MFKNHSQGFYYIFSLGISFEWFVFMLGIPISVTDITVLLLISYSIIVHQKILLNWIVVFVLLFGLHILIANMINFHIEEEFSFKGFFSNYMRIIALMCIIIFTPSLIKEFDIKKLMKGILFALKFHSLIVIFDPFIIYPWTFSDYGIILGSESNESLPVERGRGLWGEPSFFSAYVGMMMALIIQYEKNTKERVATGIDYFILLLALLASASVTGASVAGILLLMSFTTHKKAIFQSKSLLKNIGITLVSVPLMVVVLASSFTFISDRLSAGLAGGSTLQRLVGSSLFTMDIIREKPLIGSGLGGKNQQAFLDKHGDPIIFDAIESSNPGGAQILTQSATTFWAGLVGAGGLPALLIFYIAILGSLLINKKTTYVAVMIFFLGLAKGGVFDVSLWFVIAVAISYKYTDNKKSIT